MPLTMVTADSIGTGVRFSPVENDILVIAQGVIVSSTGSNAIYIGFDNVQIHVAGEITAFNYGLYSESADTILSVAKSGTVTTSGTAVSVYGANTNFLNHGHITSLNSHGVRLAGSGSKFVNHGVIDGMYGYGLEMFSSDADFVPIAINYGTISGARGAYTGDFDAKDELRNFGTLIGSVSQLAGDDRLINTGFIYGVVNTGAGNDFLRNAGLISDTVSLGLDDDTYDGRGGRLLAEVYGDAGNDNFLGNAAEAEIFYGGTGTDSLNFQSEAWVIVGLDGSQGNNGAALGDRYFEFENVYGTAAGNDTIVGNDLVNLLTGDGGNDLLAGRGGNDMLRGGFGADTLFGGAGSDFFQYLSAAEGGDVIADYGNFAGHDDSFYILAAGFGGGLAAGWLGAEQFQSGATNLASAATTRFIFRTTDRSVWYDADGNGGGGPVLLATLQAGASLTHADFLIF